MNGLKQKQSLYDSVGGERGVRNLVETFYDIVETGPGCEGATSAPSAGTRRRPLPDRAIQFPVRLSWWPAILRIEFGPRASARDACAYSARRDGADLWLACMAKAIGKVGLNLQTAEQLMRHFTRAAEAFRNED